MDVVKLLTTAAVVTCAAHTVAKERVFAPLRDALGGKTTWFGYLVSCPYCASHWLAFALVPLLGAERLVEVAPRAWLPPAVGAVASWFLSCLLVVAVAAFLRVGFYFVDETQGLVRREQAKVEEETEDLRS